MTTIKGLVKALGAGKFELNVEVEPGAAVRMILTADYRRPFGRNAAPQMPPNASRALQSIGHLIAAELLMRMPTGRSYCAPQVIERDTWARGTSTVVKMEIANAGDEGWLHEIFVAVAAEVLNARE